MQNNMATASSAHTNFDRPGLILICDTCHSRRRRSTDDTSSQVASATPFATRSETTEGIIHGSTTLQSNMSIGEQIDNQWDEDDYGFVIGEEKKWSTNSKKWSTISLLDDGDDDDDDDCLGTDYRSSEGCGAQTVESCVYVSKLLPHFLHYLMC